MSQVLLENTRKLNRILQSSGPDGVVFSDLTNVVSQILDCNVFVVSRKGRILSMTLSNKNSTLSFDETDTNEYRFTNQFNDSLLSYNATRLISTQTEMTRYLLLSAQQSGVGRLGTLIFECFGREMTTEDMILAEYSATVVGMKSCVQKPMRLRTGTKKAVVQMAIGTLSYSIGSSRTYF